MRTRPDRWNHNIHYYPLILRPSLTAAGGTLAVVGCARSTRPADLPVEIAGALANLAHRAVGPYWDHSAPTVWPPPETYAAMRQIARRMLPGVRYRRHLFWRYSLIWATPG